MPANDKKQLEVNRPAWMRDEIELAFERFVEQKWKNTLNVAAAEPAGLRVGAAETGKTTMSLKKMNEIKLAVVEASSGEGRRWGRCLFVGPLGCTEAHPPCQQTAFLNLIHEER
jgi:hypothetical protein